MARQPIGIAVVGGGAIARRGHLPALKSNSRWEVLALVEPDARQGRATAEEFAIPTVYPSLEPALGDEEIHVIDICAPTPLHVDLAVESISAGKHVIVEKPLCLELSEAMRVKGELLNYPDVRFTVVQNYRYYSSVSRARARLEGGYIGSIVSVHGLALSRFPISWTRSTWFYESGGALMDFGPHLLDLLVYLVAKKPESVYAAGGDFTSGYMGFTNYLNLLIEFEGGTLATCDISWLTGSNVLQVTVHGTGGHLTLDIKQEHLHEYHGTYTPFDDLRWMFQRTFSTIRRLVSGEFFKGSMVFYDPFFEDFAAVVQDNLDPSVTIDQTIDTVALLEAAQRSLESGRPVSLSELV